MAVPAPGLVDPRGVLAGIIGALFFKERFSGLRLGLTAIAVAGIVALQLG
ncbi:hypothetical protein [Paenarthrobacter sp. NPDC058040]